MKKSFSSLKKLNKGFTLIELLIVIVILGILATAVLVAMDPAEQINRGKDAGIISSVGQLGHAVQAYYTSQSVVLPVGDATSGWLGSADAANATGLIGSGELKSFPSAPSDTTACTSNIMGGGFCYAIIGTNDSVIYAHVKSKSSQTKVVNLSTAAGAALTCTGSTTWVVFYTSLGKAGLTCAANDAVITSSTPGNELPLY